MEWIANVILQWGNHRLQAACESGIYVQKKGYWIHPTNCSMMSRPASLLSPNVLSLCDNIIRVVATTFEVWLIETWSLFVIALHLLLLPLGSSPVDVSTPYRGSSILPYGP